MIRQWNQCYAFARILLLLVFSSALVACGNAGNVSLGGSPSNPGAGAGSSGGGSSGGSSTSSSGGSSTSSSIPATGTGAPLLFASDLTSGPTQGGEGGNGVYVTLYGRGFGNSRGSSTVTVGGAEVAAYTIWSDSRVVVQLGSANTSGYITVNNTTGTSAGIPFTVRTGNIRCVSPTGSDSASGNFGACWKTWRKAIASLGAGDTLYFLNGFAQTSDDGTGWNAAATITPGWGAPIGTATQPVALVAYPGATATLGSTTGPAYGVRLVSQSGSPNYYVISGLTVRGSAVAMAVSQSQGHRIVGNDISSPNANTQSGCFTASQISDIRFLANNVHDCGSANSNKQDHTIYFTTDTNHVEAAYNRIHDSKACYGIQFHSSPLGGSTGYNQYDLNVHDNAFYNLTCSAVNFATVDPSQGPVKFDNNTLNNVAATTAPDGGSQSCIYVPNYTNNGSAGGGVIDMSNNVLDTCTGGPMNVFSGPVTVNEYNDAYWQTSPVPSTAGDFTADPMFTSATTGDFNITSTDTRFSGKGSQQFYGP